MVDHHDLLARAELRYDGPMPATLRERIRDPRLVRKIQLQGIVARADEELPRLRSDRDIARERGDSGNAKLLEVDINWHVEKRAIAQALLERGEFDG